MDQSTYENIISMGADPRQYYMDYNNRTMTEGQDYGTPGTSSYTGPALLKYGQVMGGPGGMMGLGRSTQNTSPPTQAQINAQMQQMQNNPQGFQDFDEVVKYYGSNDPYMSQQQEILDMVNGVDTGYMSGQDYYDINVLGLDGQGIAEKYGIAYANGGMAGNKTYHQVRDQFMPMDSESMGYANGGGIGSMMKPKKKRVNFKNGGHHERPTTPIKKRGWELVQDGPSEKRNAEARAYIANQNNNSRNLSSVPISVPKSNEQSINAIRQSMNAYRFTEPEILKTLAELGYENGGRVSFRGGGIDSMVKPKKKVPQLVTPSKDGSRPGYRGYGAAQDSGNAANSAASAAAGSGSSSSSNDGPRGPAELGLTTRAPPGPPSGNDEKTTIIQKIKNNPIINNPFTRVLGRVGLYSVNPALMGLDYRTAMQLKGVYDVATEEVDEEDLKFQNGGSVGVGSMFVRKR
mgnify:FL=1